MSDGKLCIAVDSKIEMTDGSEIGTCALCDVDHVVLKESHSIPKFVYKWIKDTSTTSYLRNSDDVNVRHQDGPKQHLLGEICEGNLAVLEKELAEDLFKKIANYQQQKQVIEITEAMRVAVLSIFWRALLTTRDRHSNWTVEDHQRIDFLLSSMKAELQAGRCMTRICFAPFCGDAPYYDFPKAFTYFLERSTGGQDVRFFDGPHRFFSIFRIPFMYFYIFSEGWSPDDIESATELTVGDLDLTKITKIPVPLENHIKYEYKEYLASLKQMDERNRELIREDSSKKSGLTGSDKSSVRSCV